MRRQYEFAVVQLQTLVLNWYQILQDVLSVADRNDGELVAVERSPQSARVFHALACSASHRSAECKERLAAIADQLPRIPATVTVDLRIDPDLAAERVGKRKAAGDTGWTADAIRAYYDTYDELVSATPVPVLPTDTPRAVATKIMDLL